MKIPTYRPSFIAEEIIELHSYLARLPRELIQEPLLYDKIQTKIATLAFKIDKGIAKPAYIKENAPKVDVLDLLGEPTDTFVDPMIRKTMYDEDSLDDWHAADPNIPDK